MFRALISYDSYGSESCQPHATCACFLPSFSPSFPPVVVVPPQGGSCLANQDTVCVLGSPFCAHDVGQAKALAHHHHSLQSPSLTIATIAPSERMSVQSSAPYLRCDAPKEFRSNVLASSLVLLRRRANLANRSLSNLEEIRRCRHRSFVHPWLLPFQLRAK